MSQHSRLIAAHRKAKHEPTCMVCRLIAAEERCAMSVPVLHAKLEQILRDAAAHRHGGFHEFPQTCGGCHFYAGAWGVLIGFIPESERADWWEKHDASKMSPILVEKALQP